MNTRPHMTGEVRPWPVVLLTALGAWLSAVPLTLLVGMLFGPALTQGAGPYACGLLLLLGAVVVCRSRDLPLFLEQLAMPALLVGGATLGIGLFQDLDDGLACLVLSGVALGVAALVPQAWLRALLGAAAASLVLTGFTEWEPHPHQLPFRAWWALHVAFALWGLVWVAAHRRSAAGGAVAHGLQAIGTGWLLIVLTGLALWSGMTFLVGGAIGLHPSDLGGPTGPRQESLPGIQGLSVACAAAGALLLAWRWPGLRRLPVAGGLLVLVALAWWLPSLGAVWLILAALLTTHRWRLAVAAALAAAWILGSFYYQLAWPLSVKALSLAAGGALLGLLAWWAHLDLGRGLAGTLTEAEATTAARGVAPRLAAPLVAATLVGTLALVNAGIWQKERIIAQGQAVFVRLAPVDPRSLMQGDYMRLRFELPDAANELSPWLTERPRVVLRRTPDGVGRAQRLAAPGQALAADELLVQLTPRNGRWTLVTDAWYFEEGDAARWEAARYGEFRVMPDGQALLVGMADEKLRPIR